MGIEFSRYGAPIGSNVTYLLGAGASYNALPIWKEQGESMINVANEILYLIGNGATNGFKNDYPHLLNNSTLVEFMTKLRQFGNFAKLYGSIDIYARRLYMLDNFNELMDLKHCLSVYFDLWEYFLHCNYRLPNNEVYQKIDKRFFSLLSVILEKEECSPRLNKNVSFITWNYDLQLELAFETFLSSKVKSLIELNHKLKFLDTDLTLTINKDVIHLNGHRGLFLDGNKWYETVEKERCNNIENYLTRFVDNFSQFKTPDYNSIKYAWESTSENFNEALTKMRNTDVLVIIGYSFPAFNRQIDSILIREFEAGGTRKRVIYQDPNANQDIVNSLFSNPEIVEIHKENINQFYIPHEFLFPSQSVMFEC